jgi:hypothetical protein
MTENDESFDKELADITERLVALGSPDRMKMALSLAKIALKEKEAKDKVVAKRKELSLLLAGNSAKVIARLEEGYDFYGVSVKEREQAQKWYMAERPSASIIHGVEFRTANYARLKWNLTNKGNPSTHYKGHLIKKKDNRDFSDHGEEEDEEAGAAV